MPEFEGVEDFPCDNENQARAKEAYYIQTNPCVNKQIPGRTQQQYYVDNRDKDVEKIMNEYQMNKADVKQLFFKCNEWR